MTAIALVTVITTWCIAGLLCLSESRLPETVVSQVLDLPSDVQMPLTV